MAWFAAERALVARLGIEELIERMLVQTGYDLAMLAMPGGPPAAGERAQADAPGARVRGCLGPRSARHSSSSSAAREARWGGFGDPRESEAPVEGEALDAVRLMTIHRAKGLEFEIVCVADLGRGPRYGSELLRLGRDGRLGLRLGEPGTGRPLPALAYRELGEEQAAAEAQEERRLFYVAMTRARERLILSGAAKLDAWECRALADGVDRAGGRGRRRGGAVRRGGRWRCGAGGARRGRAGVRWRPPRPRRRPLRPRPTARPRRRRPAPPVSRLSYSSLGEYARCGYRFYVQRVLGLPPTAGAAGAAPERRSRA